MLTLDETAKNWFISNGFNTSMTSGDVCKRIVELKNSNVVDYPLPVSMTDAAAFIEKKSASTFAAPSKTHGVIWKGSRIVATATATATATAKAEKHDGNGNHFAKFLNENWEVFKVVSGVMHNLYDVHAITTGTIIEDGNGNVTKTDSILEKTVLNPVAVQFIQAIYDAHHSGAGLAANPDNWIDLDAKRISVAIDALQKGIANSILHNELRIIGVENEAMRKELSAGRERAEKALKDIESNFPFHWVVRIRKPKLPNDVELMALIENHFELYQDEPLPLTHLAQTHDEKYLHALMALGCKDGIDKLAYEYRQLIDSVPDIQEFRERQAQRQAQAELERKSEAERAELKRREAEIKAEAEAEAKRMAEALELEKQARIDAQKALAQQAKDIEDMRAMLAENQRMMAELMANRENPVPQAQGKRKASASATV
jgi:hypothetical protein